MGRDIRFVVRRGGEKGGGGEVIGSSCRSPRRDVVSWRKVSMNRIETVSRRFYSKPSVIVL